MNSTTSMNIHNIFLPENYGAVPDGKTINSEPLQAAIDACHEAGGGVVRCGPGTYLTGSIELKSNVELYLSAGCRLSASTDINQYRELVSEGFLHEKAGEIRSRFLIGARHSQNIAITGPGDIDGNGPGFYDQTQPLRRSGQFGRIPDERIRLVMFHRCTDVRFEESTYRDSPFWTFWLMRCERVRVHAVKIFCDPRIINGDGFDFDSCRDITVSDCMIDAQDDCLVFRAIQQVHDEPAICECFTVTNCVLNSTRGSVRISCPSDHIVRDGVFSNLIMRGNSNGIALHFPHRFVNNDGSRAEVRNLSFSNCIVECTKRPIRMIIEEGIQLAGVSGIHFSNMRISGGEPSCIQGSSQTPFEDITFDNVQIVSAGEQPLELVNCQRVKLNQVEITHRPTPKS